MKGICIYSVCMATGRQVEHAQRLESDSYDLDHMVHESMQRGCILVAITLWQSYCPSSVEGTCRCCCPTHAHEQQRPL